MRRVLFVCGLLILLNTACAPQSAATEQPSIIIEQPTSTSVVKEPTPTVGSLGPAQEAVVKQLAMSLGLKESDITIVSSKETEFSDACLGVEMPDVMCAQVVTAGHVIILEAKDMQYEYHTSEDGSRVQPATFAMIWKREGGIAGFCDTLTVFLSGEVYASQCKPQAEGRMGTFADSLSSQERKQFNDWISKFAVTDLDASDPQGVADRMVVTLKLFGNGDKPPTESEQQALFALAQDLYQKLNQ